VVPEDGDTFIWKSEILPSHVNSNLVTINHAI
jgi:hypothetical protein